jgi:putative transposase
MSRRRRTPCRGGIYHVVQRGNRRQTIYETDQDRRLFLDMMADTLPRFGFRYHAYCLMGNHYHLLVETPNANLGKGMHWLNGVYAARFNASHQVDGHLFQDRYWASPVAGAAAIIEVARYIAANPLRAGLCDRAELWPWSTYPMALGITRRPPHVTLDLIMALFDAQLGIDGARARFRHLVEHEPPTRPLLTAVLPDLAAARGAGYSLREIGAAAGLDPSTIMRRLRRVSGCSS